jgi:hypothetical protein
MREGIIKNASKEQKWDSIGASLILTAGGDSEKVLILIQID